MNILVYSGPEVLPASLKHTLSTFRLLVPNYSVQLIPVATLKTQPWVTSCALFVFPECRSAVAQSTPSINTFVERGGSILCLSAGARCPSRAGPDFTAMQASLSGSNDQTLRFFDRKSGSFIYPSWRSGPAQFVDIQTSNGTIVNGVYRNGQGDLSDIENAKNADILATYTGQNSGKAAIMKCNVGEGRIAFCTLSPEYPLTEEPASLISRDLLRQDVAQAELHRRDILKHLLSSLGLTPSSPPKISRPFPQFLVSHPARQGLVSAILDNIARPSPTSELKTFEDANDTFQFHGLEDSGQILTEIRESQVEESDPSTWQPKLVIICEDGKLPDRTQTPLFDLDLYFRTLSEARDKAGLVSESGEWGCGEVMFYSEAVTSTQTMLEKNSHLLARLPTPILSLASHQLAGRGRGTNSWISPPGCLQFSLHLRVSLSSFPSNKLVFVQYLFGLAVAEACRDEAILGKRGEAVRVKWPNDIYAVFGSDEKDRKKIGGILINTSFSDGNADIIIGKSTSITVDFGCGVNVLNPPPIFSLHQLQKDIDSPLSMEKTAAVILAKFEQMWYTFVAGRGSFEPFIDLYLQRWLHSDQLVLLTTVDPPKQVRICGITLDHGLLRTLPERTGSTTGGESFIDLQPDGNSFDLMSGLIKSKF
ncbi:class II aaRS and biotin synthetase [Dendrothele bispora CBS 962.96]|uniref:Class II aaRS and biotin synthetase n=1 Tax=Dendrothele bispora (strain CBS 962.96) TaxID=1314807 RepID=A0A4S8MZ41_DENBC|nr:class II aaRS and biotin synthetase [Dendrothele bispora CBS 962.96]